MAQEFLRTTTEVEIIPRTEFTLDHWDAVVKLLEGTRRYSRQEKIFQLGVQILDRTVPLHWESLSMFLGRTDFRCISGIFEKAKQMAKRPLLRKVPEIEVLSTGLNTSEILSTRQYTLNDHILTLLGGTTEAPLQKHKPNLQWDPVCKIWSGYNAETYAPLTPTKVAQEVTDRSLLPFTDNLLHLSPEEIQARLREAAEEDPIEIQGRLYAYWLRHCDEGHNGLIDLPPECYSPKFGLLEDPVFVTR